MVQYALRRDSKDTLAPELKRQWLRASKDLTVRPCLSSMRLAAHDYHASVAMRRLGP